jgi:hypothetical protein
MANQLDMRSYIYKTTLARFDNLSANDQRSQYLSILLGYVSRCTPAEITAWFMRLTVPKEVCQEKAK